MPPRLVRRQSLLQRIRTAINPWDFLLWLSEEFETRELDSKTVGTQIGLVANFLFLLARANQGSSDSAEDDVFGDGAGSGWVSYLVQLLVWAGFSLSAANAYFVFSRKRHYRLFEASIDKGPATPSAHRVRVQSSPASSSPLGLISSLVGAESAESRAYPDGTRDVWELAVWDPRPAALQLLAFFSPLHVLVYLFELPLDPLEPRPSVAVLKCLALQASLSAVLQLVQSRNDQRLRDNAIIQKEVFHEYDTKFVQPRLHPIVRDMGTQVDMDDGASAAGAAEAATAGTGGSRRTSGVVVAEAVEAGTPTTLIRRSFQPHPNSNYLRHIDPDYTAGAGAASTGRSSSSSFIKSRLFTPSNKALRHSDVFTPGYNDNSNNSSNGSSGGSNSVVRPRPSMPAAGGLTPSHTTSTLPSARSTTQTPSTVGFSGKTPVASVSTGTNFGGSLGVFSHVKSPLKKAISMNDLDSAASPRNSREMAAREQREVAERMLRKSSPVKARHEDSVYQPGLEESPPVPFNPFSRVKATAHKYERFPSRW